MSRAEAVTFAREMGAIWGTVTDVEWQRRFDRRAKEMGESADWTINAMIWLSTQLSMAKK